MDKIDMTKKDKLDFKLLKTAYVCCFVGCVVDIICALIMFAKMGWDENAMWFFGGGACTCMIGMCGWLIKNTYDLVIQRYNQ